MKKKVVKCQTCRDTGKVCQTEAAYDGGLVPADHDTFPGRAVAVSALFVRRDSVYKDMGIDCWEVGRDS